MKPKKKLDRPENQEMMTLGKGNLSVARRALAGAIVASGLAGSLVAAQTLGDVAKQEEARRKTVKSAGKVYTNGSLKSEPTLPQASTPAQPATQAQSGGGSQSSPAGQAPAADPRKDESYWRKRLAAAREVLDRSKTYADGLQSRVNALSTDFVSRDDPAQRNVIAADRQKALTELDRLKKEIQDQTKALADIQEEGRRAGVPAGWLR